MRDEAEVVGEQLGRPPRGLRGVAHRCPCGRPDVVETAPRLDDGTPFPTLFYLTCPRAAVAVSRLESGGLMREMQQRLATDPEAARRRAEVLRVPLQVGMARPGGGLGQALAAAAALVKAAEAEAAAATEELDVPEREAMRQAFGEGSTGKGVATAVRGSAGAMKDLEDRQKSRATRLKRDSLDRALLDLAGLYRDVLAVQFGADVELANAAQQEELGRLAAAGSAEATVRRIEAIMACRERLAASVAPLLAVEEMTLALAPASPAARPALPPRGVTK